MVRQNLSITFLGTSSGGGPSESRNCSSLICDFMEDYSLWMVDCAEGTIRQFQFQPQAGFQYRANKVNKIFITHMHADHIMGIVPFLRNILFPPAAESAPSHPIVRKPPRVEIYGPAGLRTFVRQIMKMTMTHTADTYIVHELLTEHDPITPCDQPDFSYSTGFNHEIANQNILHASEVAGSDIRASSDGFWKNLTSGKGRVNNIIVDAGPIQHRDPCLGYVFTELGPPRRKIVILGDTHDPSEISPLCLNPSPSLLVHEATDTHIPPHVDPQGKLSKRIPDVVLRNAILRGHSVPAMAGNFARSIGAARLVLNHIGGRFPAPRHPQESRAIIIREIERQATEAWDSGYGAIAASDFFRIDIPISNSVGFTNSVNGQKSQHQLGLEVTDTHNVPRVSLNYANAAASNAAGGVHNAGASPNLKSERRTSTHAIKAHRPFDSADDGTQTNKSNNTARARKRRR